ncbi:MAG TPA: oxygenase MpaB family protein [Candidatus Dormibacteraeota bacterium]|nr:oxygenase MpaB family protein [Candidatus Dormibacteraeota bacterium]
MTDLLYPEDSITRRINRENVLLLSGGRALLMQLAHPMVAQGVDEHSDFREHPMRRLRRTVRLIMAIIYGDRETTMNAIRAVNRVHAGVRGRSYRALDPDLLLWVQATLVDSALMAYETFVARLDPDEREAFYQESKIGGELFGIPPDRFPATFADFKDYIESQMSSGAVHVSPLARELGRLVLRPRALRMPGPVFIPWQIVTTGLLPPALREQYGLRYGRREERFFHLLVIALPKLVAVTPPVLRVWPLPGRNVKLAADFTISASGK